MKYKLTRKNQYSVKCNDGCSRNFALYFLNNVFIFKQKIPYDTSYDKGHDRRTCIDDVFILNNKIHQTRKEKTPCGANDFKPRTVRYVMYPLSKKILKQFEIPQDFKIHLEL